MQNSVGTNGTKNHIDHINRSSTSLSSNSINGLKQFFIKCRKQKYLIMLVIPAFILILVFNYFPMYGIIIAFKEYRIGRGIIGSEWVGLRWFEEFLRNPLTFRTFRNTFLLGFYTLIFSFPAPIILALLMNEIKFGKFKKLVQTITYLPHFISVVIVVGMLKQLLSFDGPINNILNNMGMESVNFFARSEWFRTLFISSGIWQGVGWGSIIYLAALSGVDPQLHEAATIDGANRWHRVIHISIPSILPTIIILLILSIGGILGSDFQKVLLMYNPLTYESADIIGTYVYRTGIVEGRYSFGTAIGLFMSVLSFAFVFTANKVSQKVSETSLW